MFLDGFSILSDSRSISKISLITKNILITWSFKSDIWLPYRSSWSSFKLRSKHWLHDYILTDFWDLSVFVGNYESYLVSSWLIKKDCNSSFIILLWYIFYDIWTRELPFISKCIVAIGCIDIIGRICIEGKFWWIKPGTSWSNGKLRNRSCRFYIEINSINIFLSNFIFYGKFNGIISRFFELFLDLLSL